MKKRMWTSFPRFVRKLLSKLVCWSTPKAIAEAINEAATVSEFDEAIYDAAWR